MTKIENARAMLLALISEGMEYPEAEWQVIEETGVSQEALMAAYDAWQNK